MWTVTENCWDIRILCWEWLSWLHDSLLNILNEGSFSCWFLKHITRRNPCWLSTHQRFNTSISMFLPSSLCLFQRTESLVLCWSPKGERTVFQLYNLLFFWDLSLSSHLSLPCNVVLIRGLDQRWRTLDSRHTLRYALVMISKTLSSFWLFRAVSCSQK